MSKYKLFIKKYNIFKNDYEVVEKVIETNDIYITKQAIFIVLHQKKLKEKIRKNEEIIDISNDGDLIHELLQKNKVYEELLESEE